MNALARTTPDTFIFLGADSCHHAGSIRPTAYLTLPKTIKHSPFSEPPFRPGTECPAEVITKFHPHHAQDEPFYQTLTEASDRNLELVEDTVDKMAQFDALEQVFVVIAHDTTLIDIVDVFPKKASSWKEKGWKEEIQWRSLTNFKGAMANSTRCSSGTEVGMKPT